MSSTAVAGIATTDWNAHIKNESSTGAVNVRQLLAPLSMRTTQSLLILTGTIGAIANSLLAVSFCVFKVHRKNTTNVFICNQTILDTLACIVLAVTVILQVNLWNLEKRHCFEQVGLLLAFRQHQSRRSSNACLQFQSDCHHHGEIFQSRPSGGTSQPFSSVDGQSCCSASVG